MHVIAVSTKKGGSAKTTLTAHLAVEADLCDDGPVTMIDADPMAGLTAWYDARENARYRPVSIRTRWRTTA